MKIVANNPIDRKVTNISCIHEDDVYLDPTSYPDNFIVNIPGVTVDQFLNFVSKQQPEIEEYINIPQTGNFYVSDLRKYIKKAWQDGSDWKMLLHEEKNQYQWVGLTNEEILLLGDEQQPNDVRTGIVANRFKNIIYEHADNQTVINITDI